MSEFRPEQIVIEPERYELSAPPAYHFEIDRRDFIKVFGAGVAVFLVSRDGIAQESGRRAGTPCTEGTTSDHPSACAESSSLARRAASVRL